MSLWAPWRTKFKESSYIAGKRLVDRFDYDISKEVGFCEMCIGGKHHRSHFQSTGGTCLKELLGLVHSDIYGKMNAKSIGGDKYFLTFIDDRTRYVWVYPLKHKVRLLIVS